MSQYLGDISAYALAVSQGYTGTEEEYAELMASYATVGQTAVTAAQTATTKASEAATSATTATNKATEATTAATTATTKASEATTAAQTATTKAGEASTSASTATSAKDTAVSASQTATSKATEATTAAATAVSAKDDAVSANTAAQNAKTAAQTAQTGAETAAASVEASAAQIATNAEDISQLKNTLFVNSHNTTQPSGTNLFLSEWLNDVPNSRFDGVELLAKAADLQGYTIPFAGEEAVVYTLSFEAYTDGNQGTDGNGLVVRVGDNYSVTSSKTVVIPNNTTSWTHFELTTRDYYTVSNFNFYVSSNLNNIWHIKNIQLNKGTTANQYSYPYTALDRIADSRLTVLDGYGLETYQEIESMSYGVNQYFKKIEWLPDTRILKTGVVNTSSSYVSSEFVFVKSGCKIEYSLYCENNNISVVSKWNLKKEFVSSEVYRTDSTIFFEGTYTATEDCYIRFCNDHTLGVARVYYYQIPKLIPDRLDALENSLPSYWTTYLNGKKADINSFISSVGNDGDYFVLFTDYHTTQNTWWTPRIINTLVRDYPIENAFNLGDIYNSEVSKELAIERLNYFEKEFYGINLYNCVGNHDINPYGAELGFSEYYNPLFRKIESYPNVMFGDGGYYYKDDLVHKIRYIVLNTRSNGFIEDDKTTQLPWLVDTLSNMQSGWYACIMMHMAFEWYGSDVKHMDLFAAGGTIKTIADAYQNRTSGTTSTVTYDFSNADGKIACILSGHTHAEYSIDSTSGYSIIAFDRDGMYYPPDGSGSSRIEGTVTEQAIYLVSINTVQKEVRCFGIGAGTNRTFSFD